MQAWETMSRLKEEDATLEGKIIATNRYTVLYLSVLDNSVITA